MIDLGMGLAAVRTVMRRVGALQACSSLMLFAVFFACTPPTAERALLKDLVAHTNEFRVVDMLNYAGKPSVAGLGMIPGTGEAEFWPAGEPRGVELNESAFLAAMAKYKDYPGLFYIEMEEWPMCEAPDSAVTHAIKTLSRAVKLARQAAPHLTLGIYGQIPAPGYWQIVGGDSARFRAWKRCNDRLKGLATQVDVILPSIYTFYDDEAGWDKYADAVLEAARAYGKPVYAFLWPEYHESNATLGLRPVPGRVWRHELEFVKVRANGAVLWNGLHHQWDDNAGWWRETRAFLRELKQ